MEEYDSQIRYTRKQSQKRDFLYYINVPAPFDIERFKSIMINLFDCGSMHDALRIYTYAHCTRFFLFKKTCIGILVQEIARKARESIEEKKRFQLESFLCRKCNEIIKDPVTLKCGHTYSKECAFIAACVDSFECPDCGQFYDAEYIAELRNNVTVLCMIEKLSERYLPHKLHSPAKSTEMREKQEDANKEKELAAEAEHPPVSLHTALRYFKQGNKLIRQGNLKRAFIAYLTSWTIDQNALRAKSRAIQVMQWLLLRKRYCKVTSENIFGSNENLQGAEDDRRINDDRPINDDEDLRTFEDDDPNNCERTDLHLMLDSFFDSFKRIADEKSILRKVDISILDKKDFECPLCIRMLFQPVTTTCGHTFCKDCLYRSLDYRDACPLCKASIAGLLSKDLVNTTKYITLAMRNLYPEDYDEREAIYVQEVTELNKSSRDPDCMIPLFVCTVALPTVPCPLHVFEPRYRLMIRQCMESGSRQFGMCGVINNEIAEYGTLLEIRDVEYFPDGRSIVDTIGCKRFRILRKGERDGYHTGSVEYLEDEPMSEEDLQSIEEKHDRTYRISKFWFMDLPHDTQQQILEHFGAMPHPEANYSSPHGPSWLWWMLAILPVETQLKVLLLSLTSLPRRLEFLYRILLHFQTTIVS